MLKIGRIFNNSERVCSLDTKLQEGVHYTDNVVALLISIDSGECLTITDLTHVRPMRKLPGGKIKVGERHENAIMRKLREKTRIHKKDLCIYKPPENSGTKFPLIISVAKDPYSFYGYIVLAENFKGVRVGTRKINGKILEISVHNNIQSIKTDEIAPIHRELFLEMKKIINANLSNRG